MYIVPRGTFQDRVKGQVKRGDKPGLVLISLMLKKKNRKPF